MGTASGEEFRIEARWAKTSARRFGERVYPELLRPPAFDQKKKPSGVASYQAR
jgi:hypothetical protein